MDFVNPTALANRVDQNIIPEFAQGMEWIRARDALAQQHAQSSILARLEELKRRQEVEDFDQAAPARTAERNYNIGMYGRKGELETAEQPSKLFEANLKNSQAGRDETVNRIINDPKYKRHVEVVEALHGPMVTVQEMLKRGDIAGATRYWEQFKADFAASGRQLPPKFANAPLEEWKNDIPAFITAGEQTAKFRQEQAIQRQRDDAQERRTHIQGGYQLAASRERAAGSGGGTPDRQPGRRAISAVIFGGDTRPEILNVARGEAEAEALELLMKNDIQAMTMTPQQLQARAQDLAAARYPALYQSKTPPVPKPGATPTLGQSKAPAQASGGSKVTPFIDQSGTR